MFSKDTPGRSRPSNRVLAILAALLWSGALVLAGLYVAGSGPTAGRAGNHYASGQTGSASSVTTIAPTTTSTPPSSSANHGPASTQPTLPEVKPSTTTTVPSPPPALTVAASGDVLGDRGVGDFIDDNGGKSLLAAVTPFLAPAMVAFVNLEGPVSDKGTRNTFKQYTFRGRPLLIDGLKAAGVDVVSLANNHTLDYGPKALLDTVSRLDGARIAHAGAGADSVAAQKPAFLVTRAGLVAVLAFTEIIPGGFEATTKQAGVNPVTPDHKRLLAAIAAAKKKADYVIVSFHWGIEYTSRASQEQRTLAHQAVDAGADLVLGHHPHVIQGLELYKDKLIAYSLGDFVFDHYSRETGESFVLRMTMSHTGPPAVEVVPVYLPESTGVPAPVAGSEADVILTRLTKLSAALGMELSHSGDRATFGPPPPASAGPRASSPPSAGPAGAAAP